MSGVQPPPVPQSKPARRPEQTLRRLFLMLFLRGRAARGLQKEKTPKSISSKLGLTLTFYTFFGLFALPFYGQPVFSLAAYLHAMTFIFVGMFVAGSAGEVLFNKEEADILLHRPVVPRTLLWAKVGVMVQVSLWLAVAFNLIGFLVGITARDGSWLFLIAHPISILLEALFCTGCVVLVYQLCLRWFGRERLDSLMTMAQVAVAVTIVGASQLVPQLMRRFQGTVTIASDTWWIAALPPARFAGFDDALAGSGALASWALAAAAVVCTAGVLGIAFGRLARDYGMGLQVLNESTGTRPRSRANRRWFLRVVNAPPLSWWLRDSVARASFLLTAAYLVRDRDTKLRVYPGITPMLIMPLIFLIQDHSGKGNTGGFGIAFSGSYLGLIPLLALNLLRHSQNWQASDIFRAAPVTGPAPFCHGARRAVLVFLTAPLLLLLALVAWVGWGDSSRLALLLPGIIALPVYALIPCLGGNAVPLSWPAEEAKSAGRGLRMIGVIITSMALSGIAMFAWQTGWFLWLLLVESVIVAGIYLAMRASIGAVRWSSAE